MEVKCEDCGKTFPVDDDVYMAPKKCNQCQEQPEEVKKVARVKYEHDYTGALESPTLTKLLYLIAFVGLTGCLLVSIFLWPGDAGYGKQWKLAAYTPSLVWMFSGFIQLAIFSAAGKVLEYLNEISYNTSKD